MINSEISLEKNGFDELKRNYDDVVRLDKQLNSILHEKLDLSHKILANIKCITNEINENKYDKSGEDFGQLKILIRWFCTLL